MLSPLPDGLPLGQVDLMALAIGDILAADSIFAPWLEAAASNAGNQWEGVAIYRNHFFEPMNEQGPLCIIVPDAAEEEQALGGEEGLNSVSAGFQFVVPHGERLKDYEPTYAGIDSHFRRVFAVKQGVEDGANNHFLCVPRFGVPLAEQFIGFRQLTFADFTRGEDPMVLMKITGTWRSNHEQLTNPPVDLTL